MLDVRHLFLDLWAKDVCHWPSPQEITWDYSHELAIFEVSPQVFQSLNRVSFQLFLFFNERDKSSQLLFQLAWKFTLTLQLREDFFHVFFIFLNKSENRFDVIFGNVLCLIMATLGLFFFPLFLHFSLRHIWNILYNWRIFSLTSNLILRFLLLHRFLIKKMINRFSIELIWKREDLEISVLLGASGESRTIRR